VANTFVRTEAELAAPATRAPKSEATKRRVPRWVKGVVGTLLLLGVWEIAGQAGVAKGSIPPPSDIVSSMVDDGWSFYWSNIKVTLSEAAWGYLWGNLLAIGLALLVLVVPLLEKPAMQLGIVSYCIPVIAIGPILQIIYDGGTPKIILSALFVFFTTLVGMLVGLRSAEPVMFDVIRGYGGGRVAELTKVRIRAALPSLFAALRIAAPAAILGAILGEYMGGESGIGIAMIASQTSYQVNRTWGLAIVAGLLACLAYGITAYIGRALTPWAPRMER
jgi:ABC-type nitrate/sulfonate/bicarbonate transport system permease component